MAPYQHARRSGHERGSPVLCRQSGSSQEWTWSLSDSIVQCQGDGPECHNCMYSIPIILVLISLSSKSSMQTRLRQCRMCVVCMYATFPIVQIRKRWVSKGEREDTSPIYAHSSKLLHQILPHRPHPAPLAPNIHGNRREQTSQLDPTDAIENKLAAILLQPAIEKQTPDQTM